MTPYVRIDHQTFVIADPQATPEVASFVLNEINEAMIALDLAPRRINLSDAEGRHQIADESIVLQFLQTRASQARAILEIV